MSSQSKDDDGEKIAPEPAAPEGDLEDDLTNSKSGSSLNETESSAEENDSDLFTSKTGNQAAVAKQPQSQSIPASSKGKRPMAQTSTNQPKRSRSSKQEPSMSPALPQKRKMTSPPLPESKRSSFDRKQVMGPPPPPQPTKSKKKLTTEQVVRVFIQSRLFF